MKPLLLCLLCIITCAAHAVLPAGWSTNYTATRAEATAKHEPVVVYFTASWCGPCKLMSQIILADPVIRQAVDGSEHVAVDLDENSALAAAFGINAVPTFLLLSADGEEVDRATGFRPAPDFLEWLTNGIAVAKQAAEKTARFKTDLAAMDRALAATNLVDLKSLMPKLFDLCAARDPATAQAAGKRLTGVLALAPELVLAGLNDSRLATRVQSANALRTRYGEAFDVDPWSNEGTRKEAIQQWVKSYLRLERLEQ